MVLKFIKNLTQKNILYYPGCLTKILGLDKNYKKILEKLGIQFVTLTEIEFCCGSPALNSGYKEDFQKISENNQEIFKKHRISKIITSCPSCLKIFSQDYNLQTEHITKTILQNIEKLDSKFNEKITYHDPCYLGRYSNIYQEPREILKHIGFEIIEMENTKQNSLCCGAGSGLQPNLPSIADKIAQIRLNQVKTSKLITTCPLCYQHFKNNTSDIRILELSEVLI